MAYTMYTLPAKSISYGGTRTASAIKYIVIHYTANKTDTAKANASYYANGNTRSAGAHYFVDDSTVYQSIPDLRIAWAVGGNKWNDCATTGGGTMHGIVTNSNSVSIEMCSKNGVITEATLANVVTLCKSLMKKYNVPVANVYRHFDVTGKPCPGWDGWIDKTAVKWKDFKTRIGTAAVTSSASTTATSTTYRVKITADVLNVRAGAGTSYKINTTVKQGEVYTIVSEKNGWGELKSGAGWISLKYTNKI